MSPLTKLFLIAQAIEFVAIHAHGQQVRDFVLDDPLVYTVPVSAARVTTVSFPSPIAAIDGALTTTDGKTPDIFQIAHTKGTAYFSARNLAKDAVTNVNVRWNNRTFVFELRESAEPCYSLMLRSGDFAFHPPMPSRRKRSHGKDKRLTVGVWLLKKIDTETQRVPAPSMIALTP